MSKFEESQKNYNGKGKNKIKPIEKNLSGNPVGNNSKLIVPEWRIKFKGNIITVDGKKCYWCKHHKADGFLGDMYMPHFHNHDK